ncbi:hypothetical protein AAG747_19180 [Rapidithrix thailandica]|uniref:Uncharacterized protein n=1 Tax=Rapidithrix thailandica TaxID=413964 RepID=A0AAW9SE32_9BACT
MQENHADGQLQMASCGRLVYYPFGLNLAGLEKQGAPDHKYLYQGKELQPELTIYDFHVRMYDPALERTSQQDSC